MNQREKIVEYIGKHPGCKLSRIMSAMKMRRRDAVRILNDLCVTEILNRSSSYEYTCADGSEMSGLCGEYLAHRKRALELESRNLWRRAADEWLQAMDATRNPVARTKAAARRSRCVSLSRQRRTYFEGSFVEQVSLPEADGI